MKTLLGTNLEEHEREAGLKYKEPGDKNIEWRWKGRKRLDYI